MTPEIGTLWNVDVGDKVRRLRQACGLTQDEVAARSGDLERFEVTKVETGKNKLQSDALRAKLAKAFGLTRDDFASYLDGTLSLEELLCRARGLPAPAPSAPAVAPPPAGEIDPEGVARYSNLEVAIAYHRPTKRWKPTTIAAARTMRLESKEDDPPEVWARRLDAIEKALNPVLAAEVQEHPHEEEPVDLSKTPPAARRSVLVRELAQLGKDGFRERYGASSIEEALRPWRGVPIGGSPND